MIEFVSGGTPSDEEIAAILCHPGLLEGQHDAASAPRQARRDANPWLRAEFDDDVF
ncbi:MAG: hypothetical protein JO029_14755 [Candidatus Eremiobacteraeota bacterium]|nr:hypothetical protein [Candidatus Eremiobacteraeota bacterium]MBV8435536.1 hypothetical protein [Candidatus Eremiobacteraeota bacterium]MBV8722194.1 hypothetical protein [Candidatus Eremiobacteraeota bacterium]